MTLVERLRAQDMGRMEMLRALEEAATRIEELERERDELRKALQAISRGEGRFSRDPLTHASNTIEDMIDLANAALKLARGGQ